VKVQAAVLEELGKPFAIQTLDLHPPKEGEVLVKVGASGVCHSDWHLVTGDTRHPLPVVPGHEGAGIVESTGPNVNLVGPGDHVILNWAPSCDNCFYCVTGSPQLCETYVQSIWAGTMLDGTVRFSGKGKDVFHFSALSCFSEWIVVPQKCCVPVHKEVPLPIAALIGCAVTTGIGAVIHTANVKPGSSCVIFGAGGVGLSILMGAVLSGAGLTIVVDRLKHKLEIAKSFGATEVLISGGQVIEEILRLTHGRGADYVFEAIGNEGIQEQCVSAARKGGTIVFAGIAPQESSIRISSSMMTRQEKTIKGTYYGSSKPSQDFPFFADLYLKKKLDLEKLVTKTYPLAKINEAFADMVNGKVSRGMIVFNEKK